MFEAIWNGFTAALGLIGTGMGVMVFFITLFKGPGFIIELLSIAKNKLLMYLKEKELERAAEYEAKKVTGEGSVK